MQAADEHYQRAAKTIRGIQYATLATITPDGAPWNSPVHVAYDEALTFYWYSDKDSQHSYNIRQHPAVFAVIYDTTADDGFGVYIQARASELADEAAIMHARTMSQQRKGRPVQADDYQKFSGEALRRFYQLVPYEISMNDQADDGYGNRVKDVRVQLDSAKLRAILTAQS